MIIGKITQRDISTCDDLKFVELQVSVDEDGIVTINQVIYGASDLWLTFHQDDIPKLIELLEAASSEGL